MLRQLVKKQAARLKLLGAPSIDSVVRSAKVVSPPTTFDGKCRVLLRGVRASKGLYLKRRFFFNYGTKRIDHGDFKDSNFEDDRQPEIVSPPKSEVHISPKI